MNHRVIQTVFPRVVGNDPCVVPLTMNHFVIQSVFPRKIESDSVGHSGFAFSFLPRQKRKRLAKEKNAFTVLFRLLRGYTILSITHPLTFPAFRLSGMTRGTAYSPDLCGATVMIFAYAIVLYQMRFT